MEYLIKYYQKSLMKKEVQCGDFLELDISECQLATGDCFLSQKEYNKCDNEP